MKFRRADALFFVLFSATRPNLAQTLARWSFGWPLALVAGLLPRVGTIESGSDVANSSGEPSNLDQTADFAIDSMVVVGLIDERG